MGKFVLDLTVSEMEDASSHDGDDAPYMLADGSDGVLNTGRLLILNGVRRNTILGAAAQGEGIDVNGSDCQH